MSPRLTIAALLLAGCGLKVGGPIIAVPTRFPSSDGRTPYPATRAWFGHLSAETTPDTNEGDPPLHYLYVWMPNAAPEVGVRVVSPAAGWASPGADDLQGPGFAEHAADVAGFDPMVTLERCVDAMNPEDLLVPCEYWAALGENDDSTELPPPVESGPRTNALLRAESEPDEPLRALIRGLYRVGIWSAKGTAPNGTYWVQLGADRDVGQILIARSPAALAEQLK